MFMENFSIQNGVLYLFGTVFIAQVFGLLSEGNFNLYTYNLQTPYS
jgi:hypothetical protein